MAQLHPPIQKPTPISPISPMNADWAPWTLTLLVQAAGLRGELRREISDVRRQFL
jgi:hypothetical protein